MVIEDLFHHHTPNETINSMCRLIEQCYVPAMKGKYIYYRSDTVISNTDNWRLPLFWNVFFWADTYTCPILGPLVPMFWISGNVSSGFQIQSGFCLNRIFLPRWMNYYYYYYYYSLRSTSGATPANYMTASIIADHFPTYISRGGSWLGFEWTITSTED